MVLIFFLKHIIKMTSQIFSIFKPFP